MDNCLFHASAALLKVVLIDTLSIKKVPFLTVPFVLVTWIGLLVAYRIDLIKINAAFITTSPTKWDLPTKGIS